MAYLSRQCVDCQENTKRREGKFWGKDEKGQPFSGPMYHCDNRACRINRERERGERYLQGGGAYADEHRRRAAKRRSARQR